MASVLEALRVVTFGHQIPTMALNPWLGPTLTTVALDSKPNPSSLLRLKRKFCTRRSAAGLPEAGARATFQGFRRLGRHVVVV